MLERTQVVEIFVPTPPGLTGDGKLMLPSSRPAVHALGRPSGLPTITISLSAAISFEL